MNPFDTMLDKTYNSFLWHVEVIWHRKECKETLLNPLHIGYTDKSFVWI